MNDDGDDDDDTADDDAGDDHDNNHDNDDDDGDGCCAMCPCCCKTKLAVLLLVLVAKAVPMTAALCRRPGKLSALLGRELATSRHCGYRKQGPAVGFEGFLRYPWAAYQGLDLPFGARWEFKREE